MGRASLHFFYIHLPYVTFVHLRMYDHYFYDNLRSLYGCADIYFMYFYNHFLHCGNVSSMVYLIFYAIIEKLELYTNGFRRLLSQCSSFVKT